MQKALGESELFNESIVPTLVWIPKNLIMKDHIKKPSGDIPPPAPHSEQLCKKPLTLLMQMFWKYLYLEEASEQT